VRVVTVECDEKSVSDKATTGALSPAAQSEAERCRLFLRPPSALAQGRLSRKAREGEHPSNFTSTIQETCVTLPALIVPTRLRS
jgi:hypothetical protein